MNNLTLVEQLLNNIEKEPLSKSVSSILSISLDCRDYNGYCILSLMLMPISENAKINELQTIEIVKNLAHAGLSKDYIAEIYETCRKEFVEMKLIAPEQASSHSLKEIELWLLEAKNTLASATCVSRASYESLSLRINQMQRLYEVMRSYVISKLTYYKQIIKEQNNNKCLTATKETNVSKVFVVHGHNNEKKEAVARLIEQQEIQAIILHEQANQGATIIEKIERNSDVGCAVCLFTADDIGQPKTASNGSARARQNVVFEAGFFMGKLGRDKVIIIADHDVEMPSDLQGIVYTDSNSWRFDLLRELKTRGYSIDYNKLD